MRTRKIGLACPLCRSGEVFYSCTPNCCFNHVCGECGATFEPITVAAGGMLSGVLPPDPPPDSTDPTAACVRCDSIALGQCEAGVVCTACGTLLRIEYTEVSQN